MKQRPHNLHRYLTRGLLLAILIILVLIGPAATQLQVRPHIATTTHDIDVLYLVCGARAQQRRLQTMTQWLQQQDTRHIPIWIGNDTQNSLWSRKHQRNLSRAEWAQEHARQTNPDHEILILPGTFSNTDGEMQNLGQILQHQPDVNRIAIVTCGFHARRARARLQHYAPATVVIKVIPVKPHWENRAPWIVLTEWIKLLRDQFQLTQHPWLSRQSP